MLTGFGLLLTLVTSNEYRTIIIGLDYSGDPLGVKTDMWVVEGKERGWKKRK